MTVNLGAEEHSPARLTPDNWMIVAAPPAAACPPGHACAQAPLRGFLAPARRQSLRVMRHQLLLLATPDEQIRKGRIDSMPNVPLRYNGATVRLKKAISPDWNGRTVLVADPWEYVDLWLRRGKKELGRFYWEQARHFSAAAAALPATSSPLLSYYSMLNAVKTLLTVREAEFNERHGIGGTRREGSRGLPAEVVELSKGGVFGAFAQLIGEPVGDSESYNLKQCLYNLVWVHRAFSLTYTSATELFVPVTGSGFERRDGSRECWFWCSIDPKDRGLLGPSQMPEDYEWDTAEHAHPRLRRKKRFKWNDDDEVKSVTRLTAYHQLIRKTVTYIHSPQRLWYLKRKVKSPDIIERSTLTIAFAAMHRLSELARYQPQLLANHLEASYNWLLNEFVTIAPRQFTDEIAAEITGLDFMIPGTRF